MLQKSNFCANIMQESNVQLNKNDTGTHWYHILPCHHRLNSHNMCQEHLLADSTPTTIEFPYMH